LRYRRHGIFLRVGNVGQRVEGGLSVAAAVEYVAELARILPQGDGFVPDLVLISRNKARQRLSPRR